MSVECMPPLALTSPLLADFDSADARLGVIHGMRIVERTTPPRATADFLADLSAVPRRLVYGRGAATWLTASGFTPPAQLQGWQVVGGEALIARPHVGQFLVVDAPQGGAVPAVFATAPQTAAAVRVSDWQQAELALGGPACAAILAELCAMELPIGSEHWCLTRVAHCEVALWLRTAPCVHVRIQCAPADARYLCGVLQACVRERGGSLIGYADFLDLAPPP